MGARESKTSCGTSRIPLLETILIEVACPTPGANFGDPLAQYTLNTVSLHYPRLDKNALADWQGRQVRLDDNSAAQRAWARYSGRPLQRASGYGVRHVWGHPWDPDAFTAGWNLCYMPFWAGMLTERQHPHPEMEGAIRQAAWELYFRDDPVCTPPDYVTNPGIDLSEILRGQPLLVLA